jgi:predicted esterase YcpF (UPF0227 family)
MLLYIHGFNSSPESHKASLLKKWMADHYPEIDCEIPYLKPFPAQALAQLEQLVEVRLGRDEPVGLIGSSLGGYYAAWLIEKYNLRGVLVNPAVRPFDVLDEYIGENQNYYNEDRYEFTREHVEELRHYYLERDSYPSNILLMVQTGDESLDFKQATARYCHSRNIIEYGGDHGYQNFENWFSYIIRFLQLV